jgi:hypothetical protein
MLDNLLLQLQSEDAVKTQKALQELGNRNAELSDSEREQAVQAVMGLFYVDTIDHPEFRSTLEKAEDWLASLRESVIPALLGSLEESDLKVDFCLASVLGKMGAIAVAPLIDAFKNSDNALTKTFALYAMGKIEDPKALDTIPVLFEALRDSDREVRDTAARALGKVCEIVPAGLMDDATKTQLFEELMKMIADPYAGVRSKAFRSLGKMAHFGFLNAELKARLADAVQKALGENEEHNWDVAYIVRMEASKAKPHL